MSSRNLALVALALACKSSQPQPAQESPRQPSAGDRATVPLHVEGNRPYIDVTLEKPDGTARRARFLIDTGGGGFLLVEPLARELGVALGETITEEGSRLARVTSPLRAKVGELALELDPKRILVKMGESSMVPSGAPGHAEGMLPGHVLAHYHVVFDYPKATFTIARPGALEPVGEPVPMPVSKPMGFPRTELEVDGKTLGFLLDTGASFTMVSQALLESWGVAHPDWERHRGAHGEAATLGGQTIETMYVDRATWAGNALGRFGVVSQKAGVFEKLFSSMMTAPIVGALAGNVLEQFRVELDYRGQKLYLSRP
jgi:predicted aspartyl protease